MAKLPVLLLHGIGDTHHIFDFMAADLRDRGWQVHGLDLRPNWGQAGLELLAQQVKDYSQNQWGDCPFNLVGFSMGGMVGRYYVQRLGGHQQVKTFVTLSSPHQGTLTAWGLPFRGVAQMRPNSAFLRDLNRTFATDFAGISVHSFWTPFDLTILPAHSSALPLAHCAQFPVWAHPLMVRDRAVIAAVAAALV